MIKKCHQCTQQFEINTEDLKFYDKISPVFAGKKFPIPPPTLCPDCRQQRRLAFRNERKLYHRKCDLTGKEIISTYSSDKPCIVYDQEVWWSDKWDDTKYGQDFDFNRPFFEQFKELSIKTPRPCVLTMTSENSLYTNHAGYNKNCYMCINTGYSEDLLYCSNFTLYSKDCTDCLAIHNCERCYFCVNTKKSSFSSYLYECQQCINCQFCYDCQACEDCFGCWNLRHKKYCIFNVQYTKEEYQKKLAQINPRSSREFEKMFQHFWSEVQTKAIHKNLFIEKSENSSGDHLSNTKNVQDSYYTFDSQDCRYCYDAGEIKNAFDVTEPYKGELLYELHACNINYQAIACSKCYENNHIYYSQYCWYSENLFGCFGLKRKKYCILNKQYTKEEYEKLVPKIIEHMMKPLRAQGASAKQAKSLASPALSEVELTNMEWGEFFPIALSPFGYNETVAQEYYPLNKTQALQLNAAWKEDDVSNQYQGVKVEVPQHIENVSDEITKQILTCEQCLKNYRIINQELKFYRQQNLPIPLLCPDCRHKRRMGLRNPRKLWERKCTKCSTTIKSSYSSERPEKIYCEQCYQETIY